MMRIAVLTLVLGAIVLAPATSTSAGTTSELRRMVLSLEETIVSVEFKDRPLKDALEFFSRICDVNIVIAPLVYDEMGADELEVSLSLRKVSAKTALVILLDLKGLALVYRHGVLMVTTPKDARGKPSLRIYSITDLTMRIRDFPAPDLMLRPHDAEGFGNISGGEAEGQEHAFADPETILDLVTENTGNGTWEDEGVRISVTERHLIVRTYPQVHLEIERLLSLLRAYR